MSADGQGEYVAYLLRLWRGHQKKAEPGKAVWHASLEHVQTGERIGFGSLEELFAFLRYKVAGGCGEVKHHGSRMDVNDRR